MDTIATPFTLGEPQVAGPLALFPVHGPRPRAAYRTFASATALGAFVKELDSGASVRDLLLANPTDLPLLVYEGEEVLGAQQNRSFDAAILVAAGGEVRAPVSCVERGRWDGSRHAEHLRPAPQAADPSLRRVKRARANALADAGLEARPDQGEVWETVAGRLVSHGVDSGSDALHDVYEHRRRELAALARAVEPVEGQSGAVACVAGRPVALDFVSRPDAFRELLVRLAQGYALDALGADDAEPDADRARAFLDAVLYAPRAALATPGLGSGLRLVAPGIVGSGLEHDGELIALCAFPAEDSFRQDVTPFEARAIARPSARRTRAR